MKAGRKKLLFLVTALLMASIPVKVNASRTDLYLKIEEPKDTSTDKNSLPHRSGPRAAVCERYPEAIR